MVCQAQIGGWRHKLSSGRFGYIVRATTLWHTIEYQPPICKPVPSGGRHSTSGQLTSPNFVGLPCLALVWSRICVILQLLKKFMSLLSNSSGLVAIALVLFWARPCALSSCESTSFFYNSCNSSILNSSKDPFYMVENIFQSPIGR